MCSNCAPSFVRNVRKQGRGRYVFPNLFACWEAIKAGVGARAGAGAIRIKAGAGALMFLSNYTRRFAHVI